MKDEELRACIPYSLWTRRPFLLQIEDIESKFKTLEHCRRIILCDFFKFAFDGSGADNFFDAGSCIDGRLTSGTFFFCVFCSIIIDRLSIAWHWCSQIDKKSFYHLFLLTGFTGFDGQF